MSDPRPIEPTPTSPQPRPTGPRTERGKRKSRQNARLHGLTAKLPDGQAEAKLMKQFADTWLEQLGALTDAEAALIRSSAIAYARLERCEKLDEAHLRTGPQAAVDAWMRKKRHAVRRLAQDLAKDPYNTVADLESSSFGCEWLMRHWLRIDAILAQGTFLPSPTTPLVPRLFGYLAEPPGPDGDPMAIRLWHLACLCAGARQPSPPPGMPVHPVPARAELRRLIASELDRLEALRDELWRQQDGPEAEVIAQLGLMDTSNRGQLRQRYQREAYSQMHRGINQLLRLRVERSKEQDRLWYQEHPHLAPRKRVPKTPSTGIGLPNVAPSSASPSPSDLADTSPTLSAFTTLSETASAIAPGVSAFTTLSGPAPAVASPGSVAPAVASSGVAAPADASPGAAAPASASPNEAAPSVSLPSQAAPSDALPSQAVRPVACPNEVAPSVILPNQAAPSDALLNKTASSVSLPNEAAAASTQPEPARSADSRNELQNDPIEAQDDRLNPNNNNALRRPAAIDAFLVRSRTEPNRAAISPRTDGPSSPSTPPAEAPDRA